VKILLRSPIARRSRRTDAEQSNSYALHMHVINKSRDCRDFAVLSLLSRVASEMQSVAHKNPAILDLADLNLQISRLSA